jgi:hypothetical protein
MDPESLITRLLGRSPRPGTLPVPEEPVPDPVEVEEEVVARLYGERSGTVDARKPGAPGPRRAHGERWHPARFGPRSAARR